MTTCPTDDTLGALVRRRLDAPDADRIAAHLDTCAPCREIVIAAVRGGVATPPTLAIGTPSMPEAHALLASITTPRLAPGTRIGRYEVRALLGAGGMGQVYDAYDRELERSIALKVLRPELAANAAAFAERLVRESRLMAKVVHPSVVTVYDVGNDGDAVFIAMELIRGETLASYVARTTPGWRELVALFARAGRGLAAAHDAGIVHRDFKPDNVLVEGGGERVIVTDFGIARAAAPELPPIAGCIASIALTSPGSRIGTPAYMAPEQLAGKPVDARGDVFAFAASLWEALFRTRPFPGATIDEIRDAMLRRPVAPSGVPARLVRALHRALAIDPDERCPDMHAMLRELDAVRSRRVRVMIGAGAIGLVGVGIAGALAITRGNDDPCERGTASIAAAYPVDAVRAALASDPRMRDDVIAKLDDVSAKWRATQLATCSDDHPQPATTTACLDARRIEIAGYAADVIADGPRHALELARVIGDPAACSAPAPGLLFAKVPDDPVLRRRVTAIRARSLDAEATSERGDCNTALATEPTLVTEAAATWAPLHAETLYVLGMAQDHAGDNKRSILTLREAAAVAEAAHDDAVAADSWIQLALNSTYDDGQPDHGLEYFTYAEAAADRMGRPGQLAAILAYANGTILISASRAAEGEAELHRAAKLADASAPEWLPRVSQSLGLAFEAEGRYGDAVTAYRDALAHLPSSGSGSWTGPVVIRDRLALNLSMLGKAVEAEAASRDAIRIADQTLCSDNLDRMVAHMSLAQVLQDAGQLEPALVESRATVDEIARTRGTRNERYAEAVVLEGAILNDLERFNESEPLLARACDVIAFRTGETSEVQAECWLYHSVALSGLERDADALVLMEKVVPAFIAAHGEIHPQVANALVARGALHATLHQVHEAAADLEHAIEIFPKLQIESGHVAAAQLALAELLWDSDRTRASTALDEANAKFATGSQDWAKTREEARTWRAKHQGRCQSCQSPARRVLP